MAHAKGHLRDALSELLEERGLEFKLDDVIKFGWYDKQVTVRWLLGKLWNCTDQLGGGVLEEWGLGKLYEGDRPPYTWGTLARWIMEEKRGEV
jgi:hypothetical protein